MDNYSAIMKMMREELNAFLDDVYCTGLNNGMYAKEHHEDDYVLLDTTPFDGPIFKRYNPSAFLQESC